MMWTMVTVSGALLVLFIQTARLQTTSTVPEKEDESSTLAFVIDVTGSMSDDIKQVKEGASRILEKTLSRKPRPVQNFVLVPFHDPGIGPVSITTDPKKFQQDLDKLSVDGGGDCPEMSMGGIKKALEVSLPRSFIYVFADASAKDYHLKADVLKLVELRQSQVVFVLTGYCGNRTRPGYTAYEDIAASSSGQIFNLGKDKVNEVLKWVEENLQARKVHLLSSNHDGAQENTWELPFDPSLREFTVSLSGPAPQIHLTDPLGHVVGVEQGLTEILNIPNSVRVVNLKFPRPGAWNLKVSSSGQHTLRVTGVSNLDFRAGFSSAPTSDFSSTRERPIEGVPAHVLLKFTGLSPPGQLSYVELVSGSGHSLRNLSVPMPSDRGGRGLWSLPEFHTPSQGFFIKVTGEDDEGYHFQRLSAVSYTNTVTGRTALTTTTVVTTTTTTSPTARPAATEPHPLQTAELVCGPSQIQVGLQLASLVSYGLNGSSGHLDERSCSHSTERDGTVWYRVDRQADTCGNTLTTNSTHAIYSNTLFVYPSNPLSSLPMTFPFSCAYPLDTETSLNVLFGRVQALSGLGPHARASMYLFHYSNYTEPYPAGPVTLPRGSTMHVGVSVEWTEKERFGLLLDNCYATASSSHHDSMRHFLIQNKCPSNRGEVRVDESGSSLQARFSARLQVPYLNIYVHCSVSLCDHTASSCAPINTAELITKVAMIGSALDPRHKSLLFLSPAEKAKVTEKLHEMVEDLTAETTRRGAEAAADDVAVREEEEPGGGPDENANSSAMRLLLGHYVAPSDTGSRSEVESYLRENSAPLEINPLDWWKLNCHRFPKLAALARRYLCVPGTSVPSERVFSAAGLTVNRLRTRLTPEHVDMLIFLNKNG